ncbi:MAG: hypothetical protein ACOY4Q_14575 [Bacillota bacterium]
MTEKFTDMDMLQDYEKDTRMASQTFMMIANETQDSKMRKILLKAAEMAAQSQSNFSSLITKRGDTP